MGKVKPLLSPEQLVERLNLMADVGGMLTRDRVQVIRQAAGMIEELCDRMKTMREYHNANIHNIMFNAMNSNELFTGGDES